MDLSKENEQRKEFRSILLDLSSNQKKLHDIKLGAVYAYNDIFGVISYRNRATEYVFAYSKTGKAGAGVKFTVAEW